MMGAGGAAMLATLREQKADGRSLLLPFIGRHLPPRGKFASMDMVAIAIKYPKYIVYAYEKGSDHMGIPTGLYELCADAMVRRSTLQKVCEWRAMGREFDSRTLKYFGNFVPRFHMFKDPEPEAPNHPNCRSEVRPVYLKGEWAPEPAPAEPEEPSFLDQPAEQEIENASFLDGIF